VALLVSALPVPLAYMCVKVTSTNVRILVCHINTQVFAFLEDMTVTGGLISWGAICGTYLRFRKACKERRLAFVPAAESPLQPALAWYGLIWISVLSIFPLAWS
jgi:amino acid permease